MEKFINTDPRLEANEAGYVESQTLCDQNKIFFTKLLERDYKDIVTHTNFTVDHIVGSLFDCAPDDMLRGEDAELQLNRVESPLGENLMYPFHGENFQLFALRVFNRRRVEKLFLAYSIVSGRVLKMKEDKMLPTSLNMIPSQN